ncbi:MAG: cache domain-containing protein, partial [Burkholderiaceae bacterium]
MIRRLRTNTTSRRLFDKALESYVLFPLSALLMLGIIWLATYHLISVEGRTAERNAIESARELVETYEAQMVRNLGTIDQTLRMVAYAFEKPDKPLPLEELKEEGLLPSTLIFSISITDKSGNIIASTHPVAEANIAQYAYFMQHQRVNLENIVVSLISADDISEKIQFSRRINDASGQFKGVVMISVDPGYFTSSYELARLGRHGVLALIQDDGRVLVRRSGDNISSGQAVTSMHLAQIADSSESGDSFMLISPWDEVLRYTNTRKLYGFPLSV